MRPIVILLALLAVMGPACNLGDDAKVPVGTSAARTVTISNGGASAKVTIELAATEPEREQGLMFRQSLAEDAGMLFLFPADGRGGFWMQNTYVPLTIAYIGADGTVQELIDGKPLDTTVLTPAQSYRYVLEVNQGWFQRHALGVGAKVTLPSDLPAAQ